MLVCVSGATARAASASTAVAAAAAAPGREGIASIRPTAITSSVTTGADQ